jgi:hypothetical protein
MEADPQDQDRDPGQVADPGMASSDDDVPADKILAAMPDYVPARVWYAPGIPEIFSEGPYGKSVWFHPALGAVTMYEGITTRPGPDWQRKTMGSLFRTPDNYIDAQRVHLGAA